MKRKLKSNFQFWFCCWEKEEEKRIVWFVVIWEIRLLKLTIYCTKELRSNVHLSCQKLQMTLPRYLFKKFHKVDYHFFSRMVHSFFKILELYHMQEFHIEFITHQTWTNVAVFINFFFFFKNKSSVLRLIDFISSLGLKSMWGLRS